MKVLFIEYSYLIGNGGGIYAARSHINLFARLSSYMTLIYPSNSTGDIEGVDTSYISELIPFKDTRSLARKVRDRLTGWWTRYSMLDSSIFDADKYDIVVFDSSVVSAYLIKIAKGNGLNIITIHHNYQVEYLKGDGNFFTLPLDIIWTKINEGNAVRLSSLNIVLTPQDAELLSKHYSKDALFQVLGVCEYEPDTTVKKDEQNRNGHKYLITGGLSSRQNEESIIRWVTRYYSLLLQEDPRASLTIAGRNPSQKLSSFIRRHGISLIASPEDMKPILLNSDYYICPVDCGGGLKLKIMDGLKAGLPVISHSISARGYEPMVEAGVLFDYTDEASFSSAVKKSIRCSKGKEEIIRIYSSVFSFECGMERLEAILRNASLL